MERHRCKKLVIHGGWSNLPKELLELIFLCLKHAGDLIGFGAVCRSWRLVAAEARQRLHTQLSPLLLLPRKNCGEINQGYDLFDFSKQKTCRVRLPEADGRKCFYSTNGWLVTLNPDPGYPMRLVNPLSRVQIQLPPLIYSPNVCIQYQRRKFPIWKPLICQVVTSSSPLDPDFIIMVDTLFYCSSVQMKLLFCRIGDKKWKYFSGSGVNNLRNLTYYKGHFYALTTAESVVRCDTDPVPKIVEVALLVRFHRPYRETYLVESSGQLLKVGRRRNVEGTVFDVFKLDFEEGRWEEVQSLGDNSLFLGYNQSFSVSTKEFPEFKGDCIYFTGDCWKKYPRVSDMGVFDLKTRRNEQTEQNAVTNWFSKKWKAPFFWINPDLSFSCSDTCQ